MFYLYSLESVLWTAPEGFNSTGQTAFLFYTLRWADNFKMAASCELRCILLALKFG